MEYLDWIICPTYGNLPDTVEAVESFRKQANYGHNYDNPPPPSILIVDNSPTAETALWVQAQQDITYMRGRGSVSSAWNDGLKLVFQHRPYALVVNNDVILRPDTYENLLAHGGDFVTAVGVDRYSQVTQWDGTLTESPHPDFSCFLIRKAVIEKVGWFDEEFTPAYVEDCDYHVRMHRSGVRAVNIGIPFYHKASGTINSMDKTKAREVKEAADRNRERFFDKWGFRVGTPEYDEFFMVQ